MPACRLFNNNIGPEGAKALAPALLANASLTSLSLGDNNLGDEGVEALSIGVKESKSLAVLNLANHYSSSFGPKGAVALASAIAVSASLTQVLAFCQHPQTYLPRSH